MITTRLVADLNFDNYVQGYAAAGSSLVGEQGSLPLGIGNLSPGIYDFEYILVILISLKLY